MKYTLAEKSKTLVERGAALPLYTCEIGDVPEDATIPEGYVGRIIVPRAVPGRYNFVAGEYLRVVGNIKSVLTPNDVLYVPLYKGRLGKPGWWPPTELPNFGAHLDLIREVGPHIKGVLTGNQGPELSFRGNNVSPEQNTKLIGKFVTKVANVVRGAGANPVFGPMDLDIAEDCYLGRQIMLTALYHAKAVAFIFCGFTLIEGCYYKETDPILASSVKWIRSIQKKHSADLLPDYLGKKGVEFWGDIHEVGGLEHGNDKLLAEAGFAAGVY